MRDTFVFYTDWQKILSKLLSFEQAEVYQAICLYVSQEKEPELTSSSAKVAFEFIRLTLDRDAKKYAEVREKRSAAGKKSVAARKKNTQNLQEAPEPQESSNIQEVVDYQEVSDVQEAPDASVPAGQESVQTPAEQGGKPRKADPEKAPSKAPTKRFVPPSLEEIRTYCSQRNNGISPEQFFNFYTSKGWKVGAQNMKDWRAAVRCWEANRQQRQPHTPITPTTTLLFDENGNYLSPATTGASAPSQELIGRQTVDDFIANLQGW